MMEGLFINPEDEVSVEVFVSHDNTGNLLTHYTREALVEEHDVDPALVEMHTFVFRRPSFKDAVNAVGDMATKDGISLSFNPLAIRFARIKSLLKDWSLKDGEGNKVPVTEQNIEKLNPVLADMVGTRLDDMIGQF